MANQNSIYQVNKDILQNLEAKEAEDLLRKLLYAEARRVGIPISSIHIPIETNAPDGGIDAQVDSHVQIPRQDLIKSEYTCYQIKSGSSFKPANPSAIEKELFSQGNEPKKKNLKHWIKNCMDRDGTYILISLGKDPEPKRDQAVGNLEEKLIQADYKNPNVGVWGPEKIRGFLESYPTLVFELNNQPSQAIITFEQWRNFPEMQREIKLGKAHKNIIDKIRQTLRKGNETEHIHVCGQPGIGKTRLVLEALNEPDLKPLVWYRDDPQRFAKEGHLNSLSRRDNEYSVILVIDNCNRKTKNEIRRKLSTQAAQKMVVTISTKCEESLEEQICLEIDPLGEEQVGEILKSYGMPERRIDRWVKVCEGSPSVAHIVGQNWNRENEDLLTSSAKIWTRHIAGEANLESQKVKNRRLVLSYLALFKQFGYSGEVRDEAKQIWNFVQEDKPGIGWADFQDVVHYYKDRNILQGKNTLHISPKALHIKMWAEWWDSYGDIDKFFHITAETSAKLRRWFYEMFRYASESRTASDVAQQLLSPGGFFESGELLETSRGARLFEVLTEATPGAALGLLERTIGQKSRTELLDFTIGRREVIRSLKMIVIWKDYFTRAASLLLKLGEAENEHWANNASGEFANLFSPAPGPVAPTEKPLMERLPVLKDALTSKSANMRDLGLQGCKKALETGHFFRQVGSEHQGIKKEPELWRPKEPSEYIEYYQTVWKLLVEKIEDLKEQQSEALEILVDYSGQLGKITELNSMVVGTLKKLCETGLLDRLKAIKTAKEELYFHKDDMNNEIQTNWESLIEELTSNNYDFALRKAVSGEEWYRPIEEVSKKRKQDIERIVERSLVEKKKLIESLDWLVSKEASNGYLFGRKLAEEDEDFSLFSDIIEAQKAKEKDEEKLSFLSGYMSVIHEESQERWKNTMDELQRDEQTAYMVSSLLRGVPLSDEIVLKALDLMENGLMDSAELQSIGDWSKVTEKTFNRVINYLLEDDSPCAKPVGLFLLNLYYLRDEDSPELPSGSTLSLLTDPFFFEDPRECSMKNVMVNYYWNKLGERFLEKYPEESLEIAEALLSGLGKEGSIVQFGDTEPVTILDKVLSCFPKRVWELIVPKLEFPIDAQAKMITSWLQGGMFKEVSDPPITKIPGGEIWHWVEEDPESRAWYLASFVPTSFPEKVWQESLAREVLVRYGDRKKVRVNLRANFETGGWTGDESNYINRKEKYLQKLQENSTDQNVLRWIATQLENLRSQRRTAEIKEERFRGQ